MSLTLYDSRESGNAHKVRLLLHQLRRPCTVVRLELFKGEARTQAFRAINPFGRVPFLLDGDFGLAESNAILVYLARGTPFWPVHPRTEALALQWMFFEQNQLEPGVGITRLYRRFLSTAPEHDQVVAHYQPRGRAALKVLERHLATHPFVAGDTYSAADIAVFGYTSLAEEGGFDLKELGAVRAWLDRVRAQPRFLAIDDPFEGAVT